MLLKAKKRRIDTMGSARNMSFTFASQLFNIGANFTISILAARILGVSGRGFLDLLNSNQALFVLFFSLGLNISITYFTAKNSLSKNTVLFYVFANLLLISLLVYLSTITIFKIEIDDFLFPREITNQILIFFALSVGFTCSGNILQAYLNGKKKFTQTSIVLSFSRFFIIVGLALIYFFTNADLITYGEIFILYTFITCFSFLHHLYFFRKTRDQVVEFCSHKTLILFSIIPFLANFIQFLTYKIDLWIINYYSTSVKLGLYTLAVSLAQILWVLPRSMASVWFVDVSNSKKEILKSTIFLVKIVILSSIVLSILGYLLARLFLTTFFGVEFQYSINILGLMLVAIIPFSGSIIFGSYYAGKGRMKLNLYISLLSFVLIFCLDIYLVPIYDIVGAAIASIIAYSCNFFIYIFLFKIENTINYKQFFTITDFEKSKFHQLKNFKFGKS